MLRRLVIALLLTPLSALAQVTVDGNARLTVHGSAGHSHNDYAQEHPLTTALNAEMLGIEADVFPIDGELYVAHDRKDIRRERTLRAMYLQPLDDAFKRLGGVDEAQPFRGRVRASGLPVVLLIDFKTDGEAAWRLLEKQLAEFPGLCRRVKTDDDGVATVAEGPVIVVVSGDRPVAAIANARDRRTAIDGRYPDDLESERPAHLLPMVSISSYDLAPFAAKHNDSMSLVLADFGSRAGKSGRLARVWATPDAMWTWFMLHQTGMQLINTDDPQELERFLKQLPR